MKWNSASFLGTVCLKSHLDNLEQEDLLKIQCHAKPIGFSPSPTTPLALPSYIFMQYKLSNCSKSIYDIHTDDCGI